MCSRQPGPTPPPTPPVTEPTVWALVLDVQSDSVRVVSTSPSHARILPTGADQRASVGAPRNSLLIEYQVKARSADRVLKTGSFSVSMVANVEPDPTSPGGLVRLGHRIVTVVVPYVTEPANIVFTRVDPSDALPRDRWTRAPLGMAELRGAPR